MAQTAYLQFPRAGALSYIVAEELQVTRSGDVAVVTFFVHNPAAVSRRTFVFRRDGTRWLIVYLHASNYRTAMP